jgi:hypothetical protein
VPESHLDFLKRELVTALGLRAVVQPVVSSEIPYKRFVWRGLAVTPMLNDLLARQRRGARLNLGVTVSNIVPASRHIFSLVWRILVFRLPFLASSRSLGIIPRIEGSKKRMLQIAIHELVHCLGLNHYGYEHGIRCVMIGDEEVDSVEGIDHGTAAFAHLARARRAENWASSS